MIPYCAFGLLISKKMLKMADVFFENVKVRLGIGIVSIILFCLLYFAKEIHLRSNFGYAGILLLLRAVCLVTCFWFMPIEKICEKWQVAFKQITQYTMGVYCFHMLIGNILTKAVNIEDSAYKCVLIYFICYLLCFALDKTGNKYLKLLVN